MFIVVTKHCGTGWRFLNRRREGRTPMAPNAKVNVTPRLLDPDGAAAYLHVSRRTIERWIQDDKLPVVKPPERAREGKRGRPGKFRRVLIDVRDLDAFIERWKEPVATPSAIVTMLAPRRVR